MGGHGFDTGLGGNGVARIKDQTIRDGPENGQVLESHLGGPVLSDADTDMGAAELDVGERIGGHADLVVSPRQKSGEGRQERQVTAGGQPHAHADHVLLGDKGLERPFGESGEEFVGIGRILDIAVDTHGGFVHPAEGGQRISISQPRGRLVLVGRPGERRFHFEAGHFEGPGHPDEFSGIDFGQGADLSEGFLEFGRIQGLAVPSVLVFQKRHAFPLKRFGDQDGRFTRLGGCTESRRDFFDVMSVDDQGFPAESPEFPGQGGRVVAVHGRVGLAQPVDVHDGT